MGIYCGGKGWCGVLIVVAEVKKVRRGVSQRVGFDRRDLYI